MPYDLPPKIWMPPKPAIIRPADKKLVKASFLPGWFPMAGLGQKKPASYVFGTSSNPLFTAAIVSPADSTTQCGISFWWKSTEAVLNVGSDPTTGNGGMFVLDVSGDATIEGINTSNSLQYEEWISGIENDGDWHHYYFRYDSTQGTDDNKVRIYRDGVQRTDTQDSYPANNEDCYGFLNTAAFFFGGFNNSATQKYAFVQIVQNTAPAQTAFGFDDGGTWTHMPYTGSYGPYGWLMDGRNGFIDSVQGYDFTDNGTTDVTLDYDDLPPYIE